MGEPQVSYRESITRPAQAEERFETPLGGKEQYGYVKIELVPGEKGQGNSFEILVDEGEIPALYLEAIRKAVLDSLESGPLVGYPLIDVKALLVGGSYDEEKSTEMAFGIAATVACSRAAAEAAAVLLEPIMRLEIITPDEYLGDVINDLNRKGAQILSLDAGKGVQVVDAKVPLAEMFGYSTDLRSKTQGRGNYSMEVSFYDEVPKNIADAVVAKNKGE